LLPGFLVVAKPKEAIMATPAPARSPGDLATFNILHGFPESLVRGMRSSFLADADYHHLTQCETLDDARLNLSETDYHDALADASSMTPASMQKLAIEKVRGISGSEGFIFNFS
jgi:V-type H+-transporting ATPase subunit d